MLKKIALLVTAFMLFFITSCGTILKPGQINRSHSSSLDITVVVLDSIGLIFLLVPGIIAFAIDHVNGTLYLPKGQLYLSDSSIDGVYDTLIANGYDLTKEQLEKAMANG